MDRISDFVTRWFYSEHDPKVPEVFRPANRFKEKTMSQSNNCNTGSPHYEWRSLHQALSTCPPKLRKGRIPYHAYRSRLDYVYEALKTSPQPQVEFDLMGRYIAERQRWW